MPTYDYQCRSCGFISEVVHSMLDDGPSACERCGGTLRRVFHPTGIIFKGGGFYKTDSRSSSSSSGGANHGGSAGSGEASAPAASSKETRTGETSAAPKSSGEGAGKGKGGGD